jgi:hypothetical protein
LKKIVAAKALVTRRWESAMRFAADSSVLLRFYLDEEEAQTIVGFLMEDAKTGGR